MSLAIHSVHQLEVWTLGKPSEGNITTTSEERKIPTQFHTSNHGLTIASDVDSMLLPEGIYVSFIFTPFIHSFINGSTALLLGPGLFFSFVIFFTQSVGLLGRVSSPSLGRYLHTEQHKHRINAHRHPCLEQYSNPRPQSSASEDSSCLRKRGHCDRLFTPSYIIFLRNVYLWHILRSCQYLGLYSAEREEDRWIINSKGLGRRLQCHNTDVFPEFIWKNWGKIILNISQGSRRPGRDSNRAPLEYEFTALPPR
jgi:hypothetical protein